MNDFGKVAVLMGGFSSEREVSLASGAAILTALKSRGIDAQAFDPSEQPLSELVSSGFTRAFNILHGSYGEDGIVQGALEALGIPYTGCGVAASALGMDKFRSRLVWQGVGLPCVPFIVLRDDSDFAAVEKELGLPLFVKPAAEGSSVGVIKIKQTGELAQVYQQLKQFHGEILAERAIEGGEYTCGILGEQVLPSIRIVPATEFYDYEAKYHRDDTKYLCPADLTASDEQYMRDLTARAFKALGGRGWGRVDFLRDVDGAIYILEVNTVPGMTAHSLVPKAAREIGLSFEDLCVEILSHATLG
ncbi:D-alanine--D-alanine ligase [Snodgrassella alvi]|jgi:D-alanine-D-alanine ligase|uniref:D-alanine--D-alanine ligase n=1 Tax=Snodgrassella alvi TaxID=1196083 RepID=A0A066TE95_9NEIS|nr:MULTISPECIES: D-alanine--D-alanine ligase [Snodgrassella]KDN13431.1 D-alanine--D-alanine ligase [Snodgrassella communis]PIT11353.1 D-alanine--D-alanine ligase [Snodgrassella communis]PIT20753.1 D-alanine--D-alanine ligase [Snodgrassella communis]PIT21671.1 D-alanine--D-alanine ligase [Snodgrassella communis]PIT48783.1 D-alanine--D-alanine ligase [Snodgrassella alvi]